MKYKNLNNVKSVVKKDYSKKVIFDLDEFGNNGHLFQQVIIPPNTKQRKHHHFKQTEVFYILEGECHIFINNQEFIAIAGDTFICEPGDKHYLWNKSDKEFKLLVFKHSVPNKEDTKWEDQ